MDIPAPAEAVVVEIQAASFGVSFFCQKSGSIPSSYIL